MQRKADYVNSKLGEDMNLDKLIVMDDVSGLADKSDVFLDSFQKIWFILHLYFSYYLS